MSTRAPHILMVGGGTGGHVYPAIAIADAVRALRPDAQIVFAGTQDRLEARAVPEAGYALHPITAQGLQRRAVASNLLLPFRVAQGLVQSWRLVGAIEPDVAVGTGGYVAAPVLMAAWLRGRPLLIQEQNAYAGLTNRVLARLALRIHLAFPEAKDWVPAEHAVVSGNPTRQSLRDADPDAARAAFNVPEDGRVLLVMGGSLGSAAINGAIQRILDPLLAEGDVYVVWQTGTRYYDDLTEDLDEHPRLRVVEYIDQMGHAYAAADLAVCRAGALTCSELTVTGTPAVLVPSPNVTADHQTKNARSLERAGAAVWLDEADLDAHLETVLLDLLGNSDRRARMAEAARNRARPDAAETIARDVLALADRYRTN
ncbi:undecaprenyldiphospho-muramoylpentapeptide beta-N-acetylglucosaminyltransferase [Salinibacter ruber]|uniref:undecaprenyldiphospho-muramoylpentapeptide beta-N-acetylglucosaminyltransferase n=1 Tax=Salinibacter ruber TaxID=146919 RepID=UPI000E5760D6|nr:undecaprenyldiphospho-muramoylpentapeptide beta-N-acetylglucosaminyltransferase [Salinibacter ruber]MCS4097946.1 UDP-N-acetylglucosamine--N-acetylmuramyl-(pentapeptide) pyrophosphoryl-undecaprenol N-acetylglucosamine transferase [Salinibacter ruber]MCS4100898.1 UDP-N-acetylglucosamine--N-acetylmuramyl-(pentapeptide) pyrophosphoryl-undecaprenol N-acetylglucosamine transferase [Salinibacter ruber]